MRETLARLARDVTEASRALGEAMDGEQVHTLRVALRRLRAWLHLLRPLAPDAADAADPPLAELGGRFRAVRDFDVLHERLGDLLAGDEPARQVLQPLLARLGTEREAALARAIADASGASALADVRALARRRIRHPLAAEPAHRVLPDLLLPVLAQLVPHPAWWADDATTEAVHDLRKKVKRLRYMFELAAPRFPSALVARAAELRALQHAIGDVRDLAVVARAGRVRQAEVPPVLAGLAERLGALRDDAEARWRDARDRLRGEAWRRETQALLLRPLRVTSG
ncbi:MAG: CHAD domain-containing protein [Gemmatimonadales bacterium]|nr:CHAD domain-containing protein [Gemmatimonadales bacterium]